MKESSMIILVSLVISAFITGLSIPVLKRLKASNTERKEGVKEHLKKAGTPTMGGIGFIISMVVTSLLFGSANSDIRFIIIVTVCFGLIGFIDDFMKVVLKRSDGLLAWQKFGLQIIVTIGIAYYIYKYAKEMLFIRLPFQSGFANIGIFAFVIMFLSVLGTVNGVNFTDGVDGLASTVTIIVTIFFTVLSLSYNKNITPATFAMLGALIGFLIFNSYKAKIFMGDTGSLALGGFVVATSYTLNIPIFIILIGFVYLAEVCSVIIQVTYFKKTGGKRIFKMTPIHHHFELCGWSEAKIVALFSITTVVLCLITMIIL